LWIPLQRIEPGQIAGLGFVLSKENISLNHRNNDIGADYVMKHGDSLWLPEYALGDFSIHDKHTVHCTTGCGTNSRRASIEIRCMASKDAPRYLQKAVARIVDGRLKKVSARWWHPAKPFLKNMRSLMQHGSA
jgi:hypothetical protein